jgi:NAD(P)H-hydrate epimerase
MNMYVVTAGEMRKMDQLTIESFGIPGIVLMENAGRGATEILLDNFHGLIQKKVAVVAGRGNNGGDGFVIARYLAQKGINVSVYLLAPSETIRGDAAANLNLLAPLAIPVIEIPDQNAFSANKSALVHQNIWVDAILGTGLKSEVRDYFRYVIDFMNQSGKPIFAVDIPSGLDSDTGQPCGTCICAQATATFAFAKTGHMLFPGAKLTGKLEIVDIGIPPHIAEEVRPLQYLLTRDRVHAYFKPRPPDAHKGTNGHLLVLAGSPGKTGAAVMTALSAMRMGAGLVSLGIPQSLNPVLETQALEVMTCPLPESVDGMLDESSFDAVRELLGDKKCLAIGPGIGTAATTKNLVHRITQECILPMVLDADGLNCLAGNTKLLNDLKAPAVLTPHPGEMARLIDATPDQIQKDRISCSRDFAKKFNVHVVLKGARTVIAHPDGRVFVNPTGNPGMASGGMGDVLTGMIAGLISQGFKVESATHAAVYLHGAAADALVKTKGPFGFLASDLITTIPEQIKELMLGA